MERLKPRQPPIHYENETPNLYELKRTHAPEFVHMSIDQVS